MIWLSVAADGNRKMEEYFRRTRTLLSEQEKNELIAQVAGKLAHDFNNILGAVMGLSELALLECTEQHTREYLNDILNQTAKGRNLTRNLAEFAKDREPVCTCMSLHDKIECVIGLLEKELEPVELCLELDPGLPDLVADSAMIENILVNLIMNAVHAVSRIAEPEIRLRAFSDSRDIILEIEDNGCGIPDKDMGRIFDPCFTLKGSKDQCEAYAPGIKGMGYGLSTVKRNLARHNAEIRIFSSSGKGTKAVVKFPVIQDHPSCTGSETAEKINSNKQILLVEDEHAIARIQSSVLSATPFNHRVDVAFDGDMAMNFFSMKNYDLVSLDYMLPGRMNGMDIYRTIRKQDKVVPVLLISGNIEFIESIHQLMANDNFMAHLAKPCRNSEYISTINGLLTKARSEQSCL